MSVVTWLLSIFDGGKLAVVVAAAVAMIGFIWRILAKAKQAGVDQQKARAADAREKELDRIKRAADAGARVTPGVPVAKDPYDLDQ